MKNKSTTQEILLMTNTKFSAKEYSEKNGQSAKPEPSQISRSLLEWIAHRNAARNMHDQK
jgi:hypothetical protein